MQHSIIVRAGFSFKIGRYVDAKGQDVSSSNTSFSLQSFYGTQDDWDRGLSTLINKSISILADRSIDDSAFDYQIHVPLTIELGMNGLRFHMDKETNKRALNQPKDEIWVVDTSNLDTVQIKLYDMKGVHFSNFEFGLSAHVFK